MASLITNASAQTALRTLRDVQSAGDTVRSQLSTGLKVQTADDNPAFFLVANTTRGDLSVLSGVRDNLTILEGSIKAADAGLRALSDLTLQLADFVPTAQTGVALEEQEAVFDDILDQIRDVIDAASFQDVNLLKQEGATTSVIGLNRDGGSFKTQTLSIEGADFLRQTFATGIIETGSNFVFDVNNFSASQDVIGSDGLLNTWAPSTFEPGSLEWIDDGPGNEIYTGAAAVQNFSPRLDYRVQISNPGRYYVNVQGRGQSGTSDSIHVGLNGTKITGNGGVDLGNGVLNWGTRETGTGNRVFVDIPTAGEYTVNIWGREDGATIRALQFTDDPSEPANGTPIPPLTAIGGSDLPYYTDPIEGEARREGAGLMELLGLLNPTALRLAPESSMLVIDSVRSKINRYQSQIGAYEKQIERQRTYLDTLTDGLEVAVADLVEADLEEASTRLAATQVAEQLATQSLLDSNQRQSLLLSLF